MPSKPNLGHIALHTTHPLSQGGTPTRRCDRNDCCQSLCDWPVRANTSCSWKIEMNHLEDISFIIMRWSGLQAQEKCEQGRGQRESEARGWPDYRMYTTVSMKEWLLLGPILTAKSVNAVDTNSMLPGIIQYPMDNLVKILSHLTWVMLENIVTLCSMEGPKHPPPQYWLYWNCCCNPLCHSCGLGGFDYREHIRDISLFRNGSLSVAMLSDPITYHIG